MQNERDDYFMRLAFRQALRGRGRTSPNPLVGAVIVKNDRVIATGYHGFFGGPHSEVVALSKLSGRRAIDTTLYVNLEPCCYHGKTPPCTEAIKAAGIRRVVIGCIDPNPLVAGKGVKELINSGIEVQTGVLENEAQQLNAPYIISVTQKRPWIVMKMAQTLDGRLALSSGESRWISGEKARREVHRLRSHLDAVLVGVRTVIQDNPELTVRLVRGRNPQRIILDSRLRIPIKARILHQAEPEKTILLTTKKAPVKKRNAIEQTGARVFVIRATRDGIVDVNAALRKLAQLNIQSLLVEGGASVHRSFLLSKKVDQVIISMAPKFLGADGVASVGALNLRSLSAMPEFSWRRTRFIGEDLWLELEKCSPD